MTKSAVLIAAAMWFFSTIGFAAAQQEGVYTLPDFKFEAGGELKDMKLGYITWGKLNADKTNAILLLPATNAPKAWAAYHVGPGKTFDTDKYFVIGIDPIGSGTSTQPKDGLGPKFPIYNIRDMVRAQHEFLTKGLGLTQLVAVGGASMGSFQSLEWAINFPGFAKALVLWVPAARGDRHFQVIVDAINAMITLDPAYKDGAYQSEPVEGMRRAGMVYFPWLYSDAYLRTLVNDADYDKQKMSFGEGWAKTWDANALIMRYNASSSHDVTIPFKGDLKAALSRINVPVLMIPSATDRLIPAYLTKELADNLSHVSVAPLQTDRGHLGYLQPEGTPEYAFISSTTKAFLNGLASH